MYEDCFACGIGGIVIGTIFLLSSLTKTGRDLDRAYLKMLPKSLRSPSLEQLRNPVGALVGAMLLLVGTSVLAYAFYCWVVGRICDCPPH